MNQEVKCPYCRGDTIHIYEVIVQLDGSALSGYLGMKVLKEFHVLAMCPNQKQEFVVPIKVISDAQSVTLNYLGDSTK